MQMNVGSDCVKCKGECDSEEIVKGLKRKAGDAFEWQKFDRCRSSIRIEYEAVTSCTLRKKKYFRAPFWCFRLSQIEDSIQYLEGPNGTWKDHERNLGVHLNRVLYL